MIEQPKITTVTEPDNICNRQGCSEVVSGFALAPYGALALCEKHIEEIDAIYPTVKQVGIVIYGDMA